MSSYLSNVNFALDNFPAYIQNKIDNETDPDKIAELEEILNYQITPYRYAIGKEIIDGSVSDEENDITKDIFNREFTSYNDVLNSLDDYINIFRWAKDIKNINDMIADDQGDQNITRSYFYGEKLKVYIDNSSDYTLLCDKSSILMFAYMKKYGIPCDNYTRYYDFSKFDWDNYRTYSGAIIDGNISENLDIYEGPWLPYKINNRIQYDIPDDAIQATAVDGKFPNPDTMVYDRLELKDTDIYILPDDMDNNIHTGYYIFNNLIYKANSTTQALYDTNYGKLYKLKDNAQEATYIEYSSDSDYLVKDGEYAYVNSEHMFLDNRYDDTVNEKYQYINNLKNDLQVEEANYYNIFQELSFNKSKLFNSDDKDTINNNINDLIIDLNNSKDTIVDIKSNISDAIFDYLNYSKTIPKKVYDASYANNLKIDCVHFSLNEIVEDDKLLYTQFIQDDNIYIDYYDSSCAPQLIYDNLDEVDNIIANNKIGDKNNIIYDENADIKFLYYYDVKTIYKLDENYNTLYNVKDATQASLGDINIVFNNILLDPNDEYIITDNDNHLLYAKDITPIMDTDGRYIYKLPDVVSIFPDVVQSDLKIETLIVNCKVPLSIHNIVKEDNYLYLPNANSTILKDEYDNILYDYYNDDRLYYSPLGIEGKHDENVNIPQIILDPVTGEIPINYNLVSVNILLNEEQKTKLINKEIIISDDLNNLEFYEGDLVFYIDDNIGNVKNDNNQDIYYSGYANQSSGEILELSNYVVDNLECNNNILINHSIIEGFSNNNIYLKDDNKIYDITGASPYKITADILSDSIFYNRELYDILSSDPILFKEYNNQEIVSNNILLNDEEISNLINYGIVTGWDITGKIPIFSDSELELYNPVLADPVRNIDFQLVYDTRIASLAKYNNGYPEASTLVLNNRSLSTTEGLMFNDNLDIYYHGGDKNKRLVISYDNIDYNIFITPLEHTSVTLSMIQSLNIVAYAPINGINYYRNLTIEEKDNCIFQGILIPCEDDDPDQILTSGYKIFDNIDNYTYYNLADQYSYNGQLIFEPINKYNILSPNDTYSDIIVNNTILPESKYYKLINGSIIDDDTSNITYVENDKIYYIPDDTEPAVDQDNNIIVYIDIDNTVPANITDINKSLVSFSRVRDETYKNDNFISKGIMTLNSNNDYILLNEEYLYDKSKSEPIYTIHGNIYDTRELNQATADEILSYSNYIANNYILPSDDYIYIDKESNKLYSTYSNNLEYVRIDNLIQYNIDDAIRATLVDGIIPHYDTLVSNTSELLFGSSLIFDDDGYIYDYNCPDVEYIYDENNNILYDTTNGIQSQMINGVYPALDNMVAFNIVLKNYDNLYVSNNRIFNTINGVQAVNSNNEKVFLVDYATQATLINEDNNYTLPSNDQLVLGNVEFNGDRNHIMPDSNYKLYYADNLEQLKTSDNDLLYVTYGASQAIYDNGLPELDQLISDGICLKTYDKIYIEDNKLYDNTYANQIMIDNKYIYSYEFADPYEFNSSQGIPDNNECVTSKDGSIIQSEYLTTDLKYLYDCSDANIVIDENGNNKYIVLNNIIYNTTADDIISIDNLICNNIKVSNNNFIFKNGYVYQPNEILSDKSYELIDDNRSYYQVEISSPNDIELILSSIASDKIINDIKNISIIDNKLYDNSYSDIIIKSGSIAYNVYNNYSIQAHSSTEILVTLIDNNYIQVSKDNDILELYDDLYYSNINANISYDDDNNILYNTEHSMQAVYDDSFDDLTKEDLICDNIEVKDIDKIIHYDDNLVYDCTYGDYDVDADQYIVSTCRKVYLKSDTRVQYDIDTCDIVYDGETCFILYDESKLIPIYKLEDCQLNYDISELNPVYLLNNCLPEYNYDECYIIYPLIECQEKYNKDECKIIYDINTCYKLYDISQCYILYNKSSCDIVYDIDTCDIVYDKSTCTPLVDYDTCYKVFFKDTCTPLYILESLYPIYLKDDSYLCYDINNLEKVYLQEDGQDCYTISSLIPAYNINNCNKCYLLSELTTLYLEIECDAKYDYHLCDPVYDISTTFTGYLKESCLLCYDKQNCFPIYKASNLKKVYNKNDCTLIYKMGEHYPVYNLNDCSYRFDISTCDPVYKLEECNIQYNFNDCGLIYKEETCKKIIDYDSATPVYNKEDCDPIIDWETCDPMYYTSEAIIQIDIDTLGIVYDADTCDIKYNYKSGILKHAPELAPELYKSISYNDASIISALSKMNILKIINGPFIDEDRIKVGYDEDYQELSSNITKSRRYNETSVWETSYSDSGLSLDQYIEYFIDVNTGVPKIPDTSVEILGNNLNTNIDGPGYAGNATDTYSQISSEKFKF